MATSIPGGAYQDARGNWTDANGEPLSAENKANARNVYAEQAAARAEADQAQLMANAQRDPFARALLASQLVKAAPAVRASEK